MDPQLQTPLTLDPDSSSSISILLPSLNHLPPLSARGGDGGSSLNSLTEAEAVEGDSSQGTVTVSLSMLGVLILREQKWLAQTAFKFTDLGLLR